MPIIVHLPTKQKLPTELKNPYALTVQTNGTTQATYDGSAAKTVNITPSNIGAATSSHTHSLSSLGAASSNHSHSNYSTATSVKNGTGSYSTVVGYNCIAGGDYSNAIGYEAKADGDAALALGLRANAVNSYTIAIGQDAKSEHGYAIGNNVLSDDMYMLATGFANKAGYSSSSDCYFVVGNANSASSRSNGFRVAKTSVYGAGNFVASGADYAEYFEWEDGNMWNEDRVGLFVTMQGTKIKQAEKGDFILGVVSALPCIIGNGDEDWLGRWLHDEYGRFLTNAVKKPIKKWEEVTNDNDTKEWKEVETGEYETVIERVENPEYEKVQSYVERKDRKEWDAIGMLGVLAVRDDGTCKVNHYCTVADGGIATATEDKTGYRVIERITDNIIKIIFR